MNIEYIMTPVWYVIVNNSHLFTNVWNDEEQITIWRVLMDRPHMKNHWPVTKILHMR